MKTLKGTLLLFLILLIIWCLLTYPVTTPELAAGSITSLLLVLLLPKNALLFVSVKITPKALIASLAYLFVFLWELIKSNIDVALRVINPKLPINPGIVKVKTKLKSKLGRTILANSITLTPGTLSVEISEDYFYIHWIDVTGTDIDEATRHIVATFEKYLEVIFD